MDGGKREHCHCWSQCKAITVHVIQVPGEGTGTAAGQACGRDAASEAVALAFGWRSQCIPGSSWARAMQVKEPSWCREAAAQTQAIHQQAL
jgi:hypothetical protein